MNTGWLINFFSVFFLLLLSLSSNRVCAHGGNPRVLNVIPPDRNGDKLWVIDTLGAFRATSVDSDVAVQVNDWAWLCDDAIDPTLGVDDLIPLNEQTLIAIAKSGLYRSEDGGCRFERINSPINQHALGLLSVKPSDSNQLALFTDSVGQDNSVWWSQDAGLNWQPSDLTVEGTIYALWRDPEHEEELWVNHARGLSFSADGGRTFTNIDTMGYGMGASATEARLLGGGRLGDQMALFIGINRFPTASLLLSLDRGQSWRPILELEDSFESLLLTDDSLWVSAPFEGLSRYILGDDELMNSPMAWRGGWQRTRDTFIACLKSDPFVSGRVWSCGRSAPSDWIVAYVDISDEATLNWQIVMNDYSEASEGVWSCPPQSQSILACASRCLTADCDPSGRQTIVETGGTDLGMSEPNRAGGSDDRDRNLESEQRSTTDQSCAQGVPVRDHHGSHLSLLLFLLIMGLSDLRGTLKAQRPRNDES